MLNKNQQRPTISEPLSDDGVTTISNDDFWDETSWISSTDTLQNGRNTSYKGTNDQPKTVIKAPCDHEYSQYTGPISTSSQTNYYNEENQFFSQIFAIIITICFQFLYTGNEKRKHLSILVSGYFAIMLHVSLAVTQIIKLKSSLISTDLFSAALNLCQYTFLIVSTDILADSWEILKSSEFKNSLWDRLKLACILQIESWIISKLIKSQVLGIGILLTIIVIHSFQVLI